MLARIIVFAVFALAQPAFAAGFDYSVVGNGCVPDHTSIQNDLYENRGHGVGFRPGRVGTIRLTCPITLGRHQSTCWGCPVGGTDFTWHSYTLFYKDSDGASSNGFVNVQLRHASFSSPAVGATWANSTPAMPQTGPTSITVDIADVDPGLFAFWWVEVKLTRSSTATDVEFLGLTLQ